MPEDPSIPESYLGSAFEMLAARWVKSLLTCCFLLSALFALASPVNGAPQEPREVIAGIPRLWPPQYSLDDNGNPTGFAIDVMNEIATRAGVRVTYQVMNSFADVSEAMNDGSIDLVPNSGITPERAARFAFTAPVETFIVSIFVRDDTLDIKEADDLLGRKVGVVELNIGHRLMQDRDDLEMVVYRDAETALFSLVAGHVDAMVFPQPVLLNLARQVGIENRIKTVGAPLREVKRGIRVQKGETELLAALNRAVNDFVGTPNYQAIYVKWYAAAKPFWTVSRVLLAMGAISVFVLITMSWWRYRSVLILNRDLLESVAERERVEQDLRESEAQLSEAQNMANLGRWEWDLREGVNLCSAEKAEMLGLPPQACVLSEDDFLAFVHPDDREELRSRFARFLKDGQSYEMDYRIIHQDGKTCTLHERTKAVTDGQGRVTRVIGTVQDITERKRAEEQLRLALMDAEQANQAKSDFLATMSHELRTPLNAIIGFSDMIEGQFFGALGSEKYREYARDIHKSSEHLLALVNDILDLSAIEAGKQLPVKEDLIVKDVAADCTPIIANAAFEKNIEFSVEVPDDLPPLRADRRAVKQILLNLLSNAVKYTPEYGKIMLKAKVANGIYTLEVSDTGNGVPAEKLSNITDPFVRTQSDPHKSHEGTGLGLTIVKSLVDLHGGELDINSDVGIGTTVTVTLPNEAR